MRSIRNLKIRQAGDTIVEVLLCLAIIGLSFSLSYYVARRSLDQIRDAEERQEALKLVEEQLERLQVGAVEGLAARTAGDADCLTLNWGNSNRCFVFKNSAHTKLMSAGYFCIDSSFNITYATGPTDPACKVSPTSIYWVAIYFDPNHNTNPDSDFYAIGAFSSLTGGATTKGFSVVTDMYRLHP